MRSLFRLLVGYVDVDVVSMNQEVQKYGNERRSCKVGMNSREQISRTGCLVFRTTPSVVVLDLINRWEEKYRNCCAVRLKATRKATLFNIHDLLRSTY